ncbi:hypothetical protein PGB90_006632 [Kerria lacca]
MLAHCSKETITKSKHKSRRAYCTITTLKANNDVTNGGNVLSGSLLNRGVL